MFAKWRVKVLNFLVWVVARLSFVTPAPVVRIPETLPESPTLVDLLNNVEDAFTAAALPTYASTVDKPTRKALQKLGAWVPFGSPWDHGEEQTLQGNSRWPALMFLARGRHDEFVDGTKGGFAFADGTKSDDKELAVVAFAYAIKFDKPPWYVEQRRRGVIYDFGMAYRLRGKLDWVSAFIAVDPGTGELTVYNELAIQSIRLPSGECYSRRTWGNFMLDNANQWGSTREEKEAMLKRIFVSVFKWWLRRDERWVVSVKRNSQRVTFSVEQNLTKTFFKDRNVEVLTPTGQKKRIIHFVQEHARQYKHKQVTVREHIRGIREFTWRGFTCAVTAPKFHTWTLQKFDVGTLDVDDFPVGQKHVDMNRLVTALVHAEDRQQSPKRFIP